MKDTYDLNDAVFEEMRNQQEHESFVQMRSTLLIEFLLKVFDSSGNIHRIHCECEISTLVDSVMLNLNINNSLQMKLTFVDNYGDVVVLSSEEFLMDTVEVARYSKSK